MDLRRVGGSASNSPRPLTLRGTKFDACVTPMMLGLIDASKRRATKNGININGVIKINHTTYFTGCPTLSIFIY